MITSASALPKPSKPSMISLWVVPWMLYLGAAFVTIVAANRSVSWLPWLRFLRQNSVLAVIAAVVVATWVVARTVLAIKFTSSWTVVTFTVIELVIAGFIFLFWTVGMIGGPINSG